MESMSMVTGMGAQMPMPAHSGADHGATTMGTMEMTGPNGQPINEAQLAAVLRSLLATVNQLVAAYGAGQVAGGGMSHGAHGDAPMRRAVDIHPHYQGQLAADGRYHDKRTSYDPSRRAIIVNKTSDVTKMLLPRTQPEDRAKAQQFLQQVMQAAPKTAAEATAMGFAPKKPGGNHWVSQANKDDKLTGIPDRPEMIMVEDGIVTGVVFTSWGVVGDESDLPDFGMGGWHVHPHVPDAAFNPNDYLGTKMTRMAHVMFDADLDTAFMDGQYMGPHH